MPEKNDRNPKPEQPEQGGKVNRSREQLTNSHDPEQEMPDPQQVEKDVKEWEKLYREDEKKSA